MQGIWPSAADGTDINAVDRSHNRRLLCTADDFGKVKLFEYPCIKTDAQFLELQGHSSHVTNIRWGYNDDFVYSAGGNDRCIFQWKVGLSEASSQCDTRANGGKMEADITNAKAIQFDMELQGDEFMAVKPWLGAVVAPSNPPPITDTTAPDIDVELEWVHGYQGQSCRNNCRYTNEGHIVYHAAALGIVYDPASKRQRYYTGHEDDITALAVHPNGLYVATGQLGAKPCIQLWEAARSGPLRNMQTLSGFHTRAVVLLAFSDSGNHLASIGADDDHSFAVYKWEDGTLLASGKGERNKVQRLRHPERHTHPN